MDQPKALDASPALEGGPKAPIQQVQPKAQTAEEALDPDDPRVSVGPWFDRFFADQKYAYRALAEGALDQYNGKYVAFFNEQVVDADEDDAALRKRVGERFNVHPDTLYTMWVGPCTAVQWPFLS